MSCKSIEKKEIGVISERRIARGTACCAKRRIYAIFENIDCIVVKLYDKMRQMGKLHSMRKRNKIWSIGKPNADPNTLYQRILAACRPAAGSVYEVEISETL
jgi:hypothetical protein